MHSRTRELLETSSDPIPPAVNTAAVLIAAHDARHAAQIREMTAATVAP